LLIRSGLILKLCKRTGRREASPYKKYYFNKLSQLVCPAVCVTKLLKISFFGSFFIALFVVTARKRQKKFSELNTLRK
ncbi:MAG: hypothetical protein IJZ44_08850, partial [Lachnospiraceae bacterium]|nr:hypothetical protein [Lachnospiraceae bacterium]